MKFETEGEEGRAVAGGNKWLHLTLWLQPSFELNILLLHLFLFRTSRSGNIMSWHGCRCHNLNIRNVY